MADTILYGMYDDDLTLLDGAKKLVAKGVHVSEVFSPFPIHGLDPVIGVKQTRLAICAFLYGITGLMLALIAINYFMIQNWPMNIGGKPSFSMMENIPAFIPICFEFPVGHINDNRALIHGAKVKLDVSNDKVLLKY